MSLDIMNRIPAAKRTEVRDAILAYRPNNETIDDPEWVNPEDGSTAPQVPKFTDAEWGNELVWKFLKKCYLKGRDIIRDREAVDLTDIRN